MKFRWPWQQAREPFTLTVDFDRPPALPQGTVRVLRHEPMAQGILKVRAGDLALKRMPAGQSYADYTREHPGSCDVSVLDTLFSVLKASGKEPHDRLDEFFGRKFRGQIFFLGSSFAAPDGRECVAFLNVRTAHITGMPAIRYSCFTETPVRPDVPVYACFPAEH